MHVSDSLRFDFILDVNTYTHIHIRNPLSEGKRKANVNLPSIIFLTQALRSK